MARNSTQPGEIQKENHMNPQHPGDGGKFKQLAVFIEGELTKKGEESDKEKQKPKSCVPHVVNRNDER